MKILSSYKKIAKELIKEAAWDIKFGEPLPTLSSVVKEFADDEKQDQDASGKGRDDGDTWMAPNGDHGGKHNGDIQYFDDEESAKVYAKSGSKDGKGGEEKPEEPKGNIGKGDFSRDGGDDEPKDEPKGGDSEPKGEPEGDDEPKGDEAKHKDNLKTLDTLKTSSGNYLDDKKISKLPDEELESLSKSANKDLQMRHNSKYDDEGNLRGDSQKMDTKDALMKVKGLEKEIERREKTKEKEPEPKKKKGFFSKMFGKKESISINGKKYKAIKESKEPTKSTIHPFKKVYKRIGGK